MTSPVLTRILLMLFTMGWTIVAAHEWPRSYPTSVGVVEGIVATVGLLAVVAYEAGKARR